MLRAATALASGHAGAAPNCDCTAARTSTGKLLIPACHTRVSNSCAGGAWPCCGDWVSVNQVPARSVRTVLRPCHGDHCASCACAINSAERSAACALAKASIPTGSYTSRSDCLPPPCNGNCALRAWRVLKSSLSTVSRPLPSRRVAPIASTLSAASVASLRW